MTDKQRQEDHWWFMTTMLLTFLGAAVGLLSGGLIFCCVYKFPALSAYSVAALLVAVAGMRGALRAACPARCQPD